MTAVITALTNYSIEMISTYVESLNKSGYKDKKIVIYYNPDIEVKNFLEDNGWEVHSIVDSKYFINFQRFEDISKVIKKYKLEDYNICFTDIKDVIFKKSPSNLQPNLYIGADIFKPFTEHQWNANSILEGFVDKYEAIKNEYPLCAGVIIGRGSILYEFFQDCFLAGINSTYSNLVEWCAVDQAAVNVLAYTKYRDILQFPKPEDKIVINMANINIDDIKKIDEYFIYHQYDRHKNVKNYLVN